MHLGIPNPDVQQNYKLASKLNYFLNVIKL